MMKTDTYYFFLTDHLGSIRVVADASGSVVQRNHFYPFGLSFADNENPETQPYKFNGKELDLFHGLNWYDYLARGMDPAAGRFTAIDPLCEKYFALSPYVFCANNPVNYIDPDGMDWFRTKDNSVQYDPNIKKNSKLEDGYTYLGETYQITDNNGNILENYRADGSIVFSNPTKAYQRINNNTLKTGNEEMAIVTKDKIFVLPNFLNTPNEAKVEEYGYSWDNGNLIDNITKKKIPTETTIHTHPGKKEYDDGWARPSSEDKRYFGTYTPNKAFHVLGYDGIIYKGTIPKDYKNQYIPIYKVSTLKNLLNGKDKLKR